MSRLSPETNSNPTRAINSPSRRDGTETQPVTVLAASAMTCGDAFSAPSGSSVGHERAVLLSATGQIPLAVDRRGPGPARRHRGGPAPTAASWLARHTRHLVALAPTPHRPPLDPTHPTSDHPDTPPPTTRLATRCPFDSSERPAATGPHQRIQTCRLTRPDRASGTHSLTSPIAPHLRAGPVRLLCPATCMSHRASRNTAGLAPDSEQIIRPVL